MIKKNIYKVFWFGIFLMLMIFSYGACAVGKMYKIVNYNEKQLNCLPDTFRVELPLSIDLSGYFCVQGRINQTHDESFIIDTKSRANMYKADELNKLNGNYWSTFPLKVANASGQKRKLDLYYFDSFEIPPLSFGKPFFEAIDSVDYTYNIMYKNVIGANTLELLNWKFDLDNRKLILFGNKDNSLLSKETKDYIKIEKGLDYKKIKVAFPQIKYSGKFTLDLGSQSEIFIDKKTFTQLKEKYPYKKIVSAKGNMYLFSNISVQLGDILIPNCYVVHKPSFPNNVIGATFMQRFNFILQYRNPDTKFISPENLYIQPIRDFKDYKSSLPFSDFGFNVSKKGEKYIVNIEVDGIADKAGLKLGDKVISIDHGALNIKDLSFDSELINYLVDKQSVIIQIEKNNTIIEYKLNK